jgi:hypothetical protein
MEPFIVALIAHGVIGGADVILNHELIARIPALPNAGLEQRLHCARELVFGILFSALAWYEWHGAAAVLIALVLAAETLISTADTVIEVDTRILPVSERVAHVLLFTNYGIVLALTGQMLLAWWALPTAVVRIDHGLGSWILSAMALASLGWSVRDGLNVLARKRLQAAQAARKRGTQNA